MTGNQNFVNDIVFGSDGHTLMIADGDFTVWIRDLGAAPAIQYICASTGNVLTPAQWRIYVPELAYDPPCGTRQ